MGELLVLRLVHVLGGAFWVGGALVMNLFLVPALAGIGPTAGQVMAGLQQRRLFVVMPAVGVLTILSGARLMWITSGGFGRGYFATATGTTFALAAAAATVAFVLGVGFVRPTMARAMAMSRTIGTMPEGPERGTLAAQADRLRRRAAAINHVVLALVMLGAAGMAVARYLN